MNSSVGPSPVWLGVFAAASFAGLVLSAFASGYHLVGSGPPEPSPVSAARPAALASEPVSVGEPIAAAPAAKRTRSAVVRALPKKERAVVRSKPEAGEVLDQLAPEQRVTVLAEDGAWSRIRYERAGKTREGWTRQTNLSFR
jgi:SH3 domain-containing protein